MPKELSYSKKVENHKRFSKRGGSMNGFQYVALFLGAIALLSLVAGASYAAAGVWEGRWIGYVVNGVISAIGFVILFAHGSSRGAESKKGIDETKRLLEQLKNKDDETKVY
jgi:hypothetical protein